MGKQSMSKDEPVDGPKTAARIISRMAPSEQTRIVSAIRAKDARLAAAITDNLLTFEDIAELTPQSIQILVKAVEHRDLIISLKSASENIKKTLFANMAERKRQIVQEDFAALPPIKISEVEEAQRRIVIKMDELRTVGLIRGVGDSDVMI